MNERPSPMEAARRADEATAAVDHVDFEIATSFNLLLEKMALHGRYRCTVEDARAWRVIHGAVRSVGPAQAVSRGTQVVSSDVVDRSSVIAGMIDSMSVQEGSGNG